MTDTYEAPSYLDLQQAIDTLIEQMTADEKWLEEAEELLADAQNEWDERYDDFIQNLTEEYANKSSRLPGEDARLALCRKENRETWLLLKRAERAADKYGKRISRTKAKIDGRRSMLSALKEVEKASGSYSGGMNPQWSEHG